MTIICCCLGNRHICSATLSPTMYRCFCAYMCTGGCVCASRSVWHGGKRITLLNESQKHKRGMATQILHEETTLWKRSVMFWKFMQASRGGRSRRDIFSIYILLQAAANKICFQKHSSLICKKHKVCLQQQKALQSTNWDDVNLPRCKSDVVMPKKKLGKMCHLNRLEKA